MSMPDIETLLEPDQAARKKRREEPDEDVPRKLSSMGMHSARDWFKRQYVADHSLIASYDDIFAAFRLGYSGDVYGVYDAFFAAIDNGRNTRANGAEVVDPDTLKSLGPGEMGFRVRKRSAIEAEVGNSMRAEPIEWLIDGLLPRASVGMIVGATYELKTWVAMAIEKAVAHREPWMGRAFDPRKTFDGDVFPRVLHVNYEMQPSEISNRFELLGEYVGEKTIWLRDQSGETVECLNARQGRILVSNHPEVSLDAPEFWAALETMKPDLVTVDTLSAANPSFDEKDSRFAEPLRRAAAYAKEHGTTFLFVHHSPKCTGSESLLDIIRGSSAIAASLDVAYFVKGVKRFSTSDPKERRSIVVCKKMRRGGAEPPTFTVRLTDARGLELFEERRGKTQSKGPQSDEDLICEAIRTSPGIGGKRRLTRATGLSEERVALAQRKLLDAERIENRGSSARPELHIREA